MGRITYLKSERSTARKELKKYLIMFRDSFEKACGISFPSKKEIKNFTSEEFDNWFLSISEKLQESVKDDLILLDHIEYYICSLNNVLSAEEVRNNSYYY